jgi:Bacterial PH domain
MNSKDTSTILFGSKPIFLIFWLFLALLLLTLIWSFQKSPVMSALGIIFFGLSFSFSSFHLFTNSYRLEISEQGLMLSDFFQTRTIRWSDIKTIRIGWSWGDGYWIPYEKRVFITYRKESRDTLQTIWPLFFGLSANRLVADMLPYCVDYPRLVETLLADSKNGATV